MTQTVDHGPARGADRVSCPDDGTSPATCTTELELLDGSVHSGTARCVLVPGHRDPVHEARWTQSDGDERDVNFRDGDRYEVKLGKIVREPAPPPAPTPSKKAKRAAPEPAPAAPPAATSIRMLPLEQLHESPTNPRKTWGDMTELTASVARLGVLQPLLARPLGGDNGYELVFGHRRFRAAKSAKVAEIPVMIREMTDREALEAQVVENSARQDVHPLEEAESFEALHGQHGLAVEEIAAKVGKSKASVYARMKLCALCPEARKSFYDGKLSPSVALLVARVPAAMQPDALEQLTKRAEAWPHEGGPLPFRDAADLLEERYTLDLAHAPFDRKDLTLVPGAPACAECPKRAGNQKGLFDDDPLPADVCTDPTCFAAKREAHAARVAAKLEAKGIAVVQGKRQKFGDVNPPRGFVPVTGLVQGKRVEDLLEKARSKAPRTPTLKALQQKTMMIGESGKPVEVVREEDLRKALDLKEATKRAPYDYKVEQEKAERERAIEEAAENAVHGALVAKVESSGKLSTALLRLLVLDAIGYDARFVAWRRGWAKKSQFNPQLEPHIEKLSEKQLLGLLVEVVLDQHVDEACELLGVDHKAIAKLAREKAKIEQDAKKKPEEPKPAGKVAKKATKAKKGGKKS